MDEDLVTQGVRGRQLLSDVTNQPQSTSSGSSGQNGGGQDLRWGEEWEVRYRIRVGRLADPFIQENYWWGR